jgi:hypothetical protein
MSINITDELTSMLGYQLQDFRKQGRDNGLDQATIKQVVENYFDNDPSLKDNKLPDFVYAAVESLEQVDMSDDSNLFKEKVSPTAVNENLEEVSAGRSFGSTCSDGSCDVSTMMESYQHVNDQGDRFKTMSTLFNLFGVSQHNEFTETFAPIIPIDTKLTGYRFETEIKYATERFVRDLSGNEPDVKKIPFIDILENPDLIREDRLLAIPVVHDENDESTKENLVLEMKYVNTEKGENIESAPIKPRKTIDLIGLSQTTKDIGEGGKRTTEDTLDRNISLKSVYAKLTGQVDNVETTEYFKFSTQRLPEIDFKPMVTGTTNEFKLMFKYSEFYVNIGKTTQFNGAVSKLLEPLADRNLKVKLGIEVQGDFNMSNNAQPINVYPSGPVADFEVIEIYNSDNVPLTKDDTYRNDVIELFKSFKFNGYDLTAYLTNDTKRVAGRVFTYEKFAKQILVHKKQPIIFHGNDSDEKNDFRKMADMVGQFKVNFAWDTIIAFKDWVNHIKKTTMNGEKPGAGMYVPAETLINPVFKHYEFDVSNIVHTQRNKTRQEDLIYTIHQMIGDKLNNLVRESKMDLAKQVSETVTGKLKYDIVIGMSKVTHEKLYTGYKGGHDFGDNFNVKIVNVDRREKYIEDDLLYIGFSNHSSPTKNSKPNILSSGATFWSSETVIKQDVMLSGNTYHTKQFVVQPRYEPFYFLPILMLVNIKNLHIARYGSGHITTNINFMSSSN